MRHSARFRPGRARPAVLLLIGGVSVLPLALVWQLRSAGLVGSVWLSLVSASLAVTVVLGPWAWLRRRRTDRRLVDALRQVSEVQSCQMAVAQLPPGRRARVLRH